MAKIENVCVDIKVGKKEYHLKNLILDVYLNRYANALIEDYKKIVRSQKCCTIKFDTPVPNITPSLVMHNDDFDIALIIDKIDEEISPNKITTKYNWSNYIYDYNKGGAPHKWSEYNGKKICTLGFNCSFGVKIEINSILDISNYDIYVEEGQEIYITRIDTVSTDAEFYPSDINKIKGPIHLTSNGIKGLLPSKTIWDNNHVNARIIHNNTYAKLIKIGLSNDPKAIQREFNLEENYEVINNTFKIKNLYSPKGIYPSDDLYPSNNLYPDDIPYEYLILKFVLYQEMDNGTYEIEDVFAADTGEWYLQAIPLRKNGKIDLNIKYERG